MQTRWTPKRRHDRPFLISEAGELSTLAAAGIVAIRTAKTEHSALLANGNQVADKGGYVRADGTEGDLVEVTGDLADIDLADNPFDCEFIGSIPLIERAGVLTDLKLVKSLVATSLLRRRTQYLDGPQPIFVRSSALDGTAAVTNEMVLEKGGGMAKRVTQFFLAMFLLLAWPLVNAGKYPYPELINQIADDTRDILFRHGMPIRPDRESLWFKHSAVPGSYILFFYQEDEIPLQAKVDIIHYCMTLYEKRERKDEFRILMYREKFEPRLFKPKPSFELTLRGDD